MATTDYYLFDVDYKAAEGVPPPPIVFHANLRCRVADVQAEIMRFRPHIIHFYAHMNVEGVLLMDERALWMLDRSRVIACRQSCSVTSRRHTWRTYAVSC